FSWLQMTNMISYQGLVRTFPSGIPAVKEQPAPVKNTNGLLLSLALRINSAKSDILYCGGILSILLKPYFNYVLSYSEPSTN
ncbi:hypothetical protein ACSZOH_20620, partial [Aeromonas caviae]